MPTPVDRGVRPLRHLCRGLHAGRCLERRCPQEDIGGVGGGRRKEGKAQKRCDSDTAWLTLVLRGILEALSLS